MKINVYVVEFLWKLLNWPYVITKAEIITNRLLVLFILDPRAANPS